MRRARGFTIIEMLVVLALSGIISGLVAFNIRDALNRSRVGAEQVAQFLRTARARALASANSYIVRPVDSHHLEAIAVQSCNNATRLPSTTSRDLTLPFDLSIAPTNWEVCFQARGLARGQANANVNFSLQSLASSSYGAQSWNLEIGLGGAVTVDGHI